MIQFKYEKYDENHVKKYDEFTMNFLEKQLSSYEREIINTAFEKLIDFLFQKIM